MYHTNIYHSFVRSFYCVIYVYIFFFSSVFSSKLLYVLFCFTAPRQENRRREEGQKHYVRTVVLEYS